MLGLFFLYRYCFCDLSQPTVNLVKFLIFDFYALTKKKGRIGRGELQVSSAKQRLYLVVCQVVVEEDSVESLHLRVKVQVGG